MITVCRRLTFCAGHRVYGHESKCANLHGHNYVVFIHARSPELDSLGRVVDFSVLKDTIGSWIDSFWDHGFLVSNEDPFRLVLLNDIKQKWYLMDNPTAENMAKRLLITANDLLKDTPVQVFKVVLWETENCFAEVTLDTPPVA